MQNQLPDFSKLTWKCHCCSKPRQDKFIKVAIHDTSKLFSHDTGSMYVNVRHCVDNEECKKNASNREWVINAFFKTFINNDNKIMGEK
jgi:hypothetical protein